jgi:hypothetical protein
MKDGYLGKCIECARKDVNTNREKKVEYYRAYDRNRGFRETDRLKIIARNAARTLDRKPCEICGAEKADAHHDDYSKPLDVRWLCETHHSEHHRKFR